MNKNDFKVRITDVQSNQEFSQILFSRYIDISNVEKKMLRFSYLIVAQLR